MAPGAPGWLRQLSSWFWLRSWSQCRGIEPCIGLHAENGACLRFSLSLSLPLSLAFVHSLSLSLSQNKWINTPVFSFQIFLFSSLHIFWIFFFIYNTNNFVIPHFILNFINYVFTPVKILMCQIPQYILTSGFSTCLR